MTRFSGTEPKRSLEAEKEGRIPGKRAFWNRSVDTTTALKGVLYNPKA